MKTSKPLVATCPSCSTDFDIDPRRVPRDGIPAVCSACDRVFRINLPAGETRFPGGGETGAQPSEEEAPPLDRVISSGDGSVPATVEETGPEPGVRELPPEEPEPEPSPPQVESAAAETAVAGTLSAAASRFGRRTPEDRARRLARVLVSDMITYHPARYEEARAAGTLAEDFEEKIDKSWEEYVEQVGHDLAEGTDFFVAALNDILGRGEELFSGTGRPH